MPSRPASPTLARREAALELEKDYIKRILRDLARALARVLGLKEAGRLEEALDELERAKGEVLGVDPARLALVDPASAALLLRTAQRIDAYARLLALEAELRRERNPNDLGVPALVRRALALFDEATRRSSAPDPERDHARTKIERLLER